MSQVGVGTNDARLALSKLNRSLSEPRFKAGFFVQMYPNQGVSCRNIGQVPLCDSQSCAADFMDQTKSNKIGHECNVYSFCSPLYH